LKLENKADWRKFLRQYVDKIVANGMVTTLFTVIEHSLIAGDTVGVEGILTIKPIVRKGRVVKNKHTGEDITVPDKRTLACVVRKEMKEKLNKEE